MEIKNKIAENIKLLRKEKNLTQQQLADLTGITLRSIRNYENAIHEPNAKSMSSLEKFFDVSASFLRGETNQRNPIMQWDDDEIMDTIKEEFVPLLKNILHATSQEKEKNQKLIFDILIELKSILNISDNYTKNLIIDLLQINIHNMNETARKHIKEKSK